MTIQHCWIRMNMGGDVVIRGDARQMGEYLSLFRGQYRVVVADCPWWYPDQRKERKDGKGPTRGIGSCHHYDSMKTDELCALPVGDICARESLLFMWTTAPKLPEAMKVLDAWGFVYSTIAFVWVKLNKGRARKTDHEQAGWLDEKGMYGYLRYMTAYGPGSYTGSNVELVLVAKRKRRRTLHHGEYKAPQVFYGPRLAHSQKPDEIQRMIQRMYDGEEHVPRLELFARRPLTGWDTFGNELLDEEMDSVKGA